MNYQLCLIEDDKLIADMYKSKFKTKKISLKHFLDGSEAIEWLTSNKVKCILLDILLPKMNGFQILKAIRKIPAHINTPVIIVTNLTPADSHLNDRLRESLGITAYYVKSQINPSDLVAQIQVIIS